MSRAEELRRWSIRWDLERELPEPILFEAPNGIICDAPQAVEFIHDLESTLARRDAKIAELERGLLDGMVAALQDSEEERTRIAAAQAEVIQRDERIAELEHKIEAFKENFARRLDIAARLLASADVDMARAEVPEWCQEIVRRARRWNATGLGPQTDMERAEFALAQALDELTPDQLRACGIEP
jgi:DNA repair exonuclease SbcCD ATPase subunit